MSDKKKPATRRSINLYIQYEANKGIAGYYQYSLEMAKLVGGSPIYVELMEAKLKKITATIARQAKKLAKVELEKAANEKKLEEQTKV